MYPPVSGLAFMAETKRPKLRPKRVGVHKDGDSAHVTPAPGILKPVQEGEAVLLAGPPALWRFDAVDGASA